MDGEPIVTLERRWGRSPDTAMDPLSLLAIIARKPRSCVLLQCLFDRFGSVFPQCGLMVFPGVVIVSR